MNKFWVSRSRDTSLQLDFLSFMPIRHYCLTMNYKFYVRLFCFSKCCDLSCMKFGKQFDCGVHLPPTDMFVGLCAYTMHDLLLFAIIYS